MTDHKLEVLIENFKKQLNAYCDDVEITHKLLEKFCKELKKQNAKSARWISAV